MGKVVKTSYLARKGVMERKENRFSMKDDAKKSNQKERMMKKVKMLWMPVLLGILLMATLVGVAGAKPSARPEASPQLQDWMTSPYHCIPLRDNVDWEYGQFGLDCMTATCYFYCPLKPPNDGLIRVQRLAMYARDNGAGQINVTLRQHYAKTGSTVNRLGVQSTTDSANDPEAYAYNPSNFKANELQDVYVYVEFTGTTQRLYGFKLKYEDL